MKKILKTITLFLCTMFLNTILAQAPTIEWVKTFGGYSDDTGNEIVVDDSGNTYIIGEFQSPLTISFANDTLTYTPIGAQDVFIQKLDQDGNSIWFRQIGGVSYLRGFKLSIDNQSNIMVMGAFNGSVDFDAGNSPLVLSSINNSTFLLKCDTDGNTVWLKQIDGVKATAIAFDSNNDLITAGVFNGMADFDPNSGIHNVSSVGNSIFIHKMTSDGNFLWVKDISVTNLDQIYSITIDEMNNIYTTGFFLNTVDFDPGLGVFNLSSNSSEDIFIQKLNTNGDFLWAKQMGGFSPDRGRAITVDPFGHVYIAGDFGGTVDFDTSVGIDTITSNGFSDIFIQKLDTDGNYLWTKQVGGSAFDYAYDVVTDDQGQVYVSGSFYSTADFDPNSTVFEMTATGTSDAFLLKVDPNGDFLWAKQFGGLTDERANAIVVTSSYDVFTIGFFDLTVDYQTSIGLESVTSAGDHDVYVMKIAQCPASYFTDIQQACESYIWIDGLTYTASNNIATYILANTFGCDSVITLQLDLTTIDASTTLDNGTISSNNINANSFQWLDCSDDFSPISGETNSSFTPIQNGSYALMLIENNCIDTSVCVEINNIGFDEVSELDRFTLYPNPSNGQFVLIFSEVIQELKIEILDILGRQVFEQNYQNSDKLNLNLNQPAGVYQLTINTIKSNKTIKILID